MRARTVLILPAALAAVSAVAAAYSYSKRGVCTDLAVCTAVFAVSLILTLWLARAVRAEGEAERASKDPVFLVRTSGPAPERAEPEKPLKGKMPDH